MLLLIAYRSRLTNIDLTSVDLASGMHFTARADIARPHPIFPGAPFSISFRLSCPQESVPIRLQERKEPKTRDKDISDWNESGD